MKRIILLLFVIGGFVMLSFLFGEGRVVSKPEMYSAEDRAERLPEGSVVPLSFPPLPSWEYSFEEDGVLEEAAAMEGSNHSAMWVSSGAELLMENGIGRTIQGMLPADSKWKIAYEKSNPTDTERGYRPQNIFRLVTKTKWRNVSQELYFRVKRINMTESPYRNASNGLFLLSRYQDASTLYYAGIRVDGSAVIKKKSGGAYTTLYIKPLFATDIAYNPDANPSLLPGGGKWIGLRSVAENVSEGVKIRLFIDKDRTGQWLLAGEAVDTGVAGGLPINKEGFAGVRTDFADVEFDDYRLSAL